MKPQLGINPEQLQQIAEDLKGVLADSYTLYLMTHYFHWNVSGPHFRELHLLFEEQYTELATAVDDIAERIRTLGFPAPGTYQQFSELSNIKEIVEIPEPFKMVEYLADANEAVVRRCRAALAIAQEGDDESTAALVSDRMRVHEKNSWLLRSHL